MPSSSTLAPQALASRTIALRLASVIAGGRPRSASLPPSSTITMPGLCCASSAGSRERPPAVVSPLTLALTTCHPLRSRCRRCCSSSTQPLPRASPYSADRLSPTTRTGPRGAAGAAAPMAAMASRLQCSSSARRRRLEVEPCMPEPIIAVQHVTKQVADATGTLTILHDISFELRERESVAIVGASGSGKSTLLSIIAGLDVPSSGQVRLAGTELFALDEDARAAVRARKLGFVFQSFQLLGNLNALENVMLPLELLGRPDARARAAEMLGRVGLGSRLGHYPRVLSGGEQQRVALARAFVVRPAVLLADEPTGSLDFATGATVMELMFELNRELGTTLVLVTHDLAIAARCQRRLTIDAGRVTEDRDERVEAL